LFGDYSNQSTQAIERFEMAASIGEQLRLAREGRGIPLREISDQTRISIRYLEAIESNDYRRLPGGVFNRSFIKAYARCVGYDEKEAVEGYTRYLREHGDSGDEVNTTPIQSKVYTETPATRSPVLTVVLAILILALLTAGALAALHWLQKRASVSPSPNQPVLAKLKNSRDTPSIKVNLGLKRTEHRAVLQ
jgi:cytoskeletal protein RodZ